MSFKNPFFSGKVIEKSPGQLKTEGTQEELE